MTNQELPQLISRPLSDDGDVQRIRELLLNVQAITPVDWNWAIRRWDGWRYHRSSAEWDPAWSTSVRLWETARGNVVGAAHSESNGDVHLQIHPDYRHLIEEEMLVWAEQNLARHGEKDEVKALETFVFDYDTPRMLLLEGRGYERLEHGGVTRLLRLGQRPLSRPEPADGYDIGTTRAGNGGDQQGVADILNAAFNRKIHTAVEIAVFTANSPSFRHELDLVARAPDGSFAAYVGVTYDERNRRGTFEPVCTHPGHRRLGLARALMLEGLWRLRELGAADVIVGTGDDFVANRFYEAMGFTESYCGRVWRRSLGSVQANVTGKDTGWTNPF